jgi:tartrate-resistant acid phosphatase type 5
MRISTVYRIPALVCPLVFAAIAALGSCSDQEFAEDGLEEVGERELTTIRFAVIGDFGQAGSNELGVANLVKSWSPDLVITTGDNNYPDGTAATIDANIGQYYSSFIYPYFGDHGDGSPTGTNRFFPSLGNHDTKTGGGQPYLDYFTLSGNERYYDFVRGPVHFFAINSNFSEQDGRSSSSKQALWLKDGLAASDSPWKIVYFHHPPYSSSNHGSDAALQWPFKEWGASAVLTGHDHVYERVIRDGFPYMVNGLGGKSKYSTGSPVAGSVVRYNSDYGAQLVTATETSLTFKFYTRTGVLVDSYTLTTDPVPDPDPDGPVTVSFTDAADTYIAQHQPNANYAGMSTIKLDGDAPKGSGRDQRGLVRWDISKIPPGSTVTAASIKVHVQVAAPGEAYEIVQLLRSWSETSVTWNWPWASPGATSGTDKSSVILGVVGSASKGPLTVNLNADGLEVVQGWVDKSSTNYGLMIFDTSDDDALEFSQSENADPSRRPTLTVTYQP